MSTEQLKIQKVWIFRNSADQSICENPAFVGGTIFGSDICCSLSACVVNHITRNGSGKGHIKCGSRPSIVHHNLSETHSSVYVVLFGAPTRFALVTPRPGGIHVRLTL